MRSRSSRFFVVMLHMIGVSHHLPNHKGIVGVNPSPIVLEEVHLDELLGLRNGGGRVQWRLLEQTLSDMPVWLQDKESGACLGPTAQFVECGDATLWIVSPSRTTRRPFLMGWFGLSDDEESEPPQTQGWNFQVLDYEASQGLQSTEPQQRRRRRRRAPECLSFNKRSGDVRVSKCERQRSTWEMNFETGSLQALTSTQPLRNNNINQMDGGVCLWKGEKNAVDIDACSASRGDASQIVNFSLVRYRAVEKTPSAATSSAAESSKGETATPSSESHQPSLRPALQSPETGPTEAPQSSPSLLSSHDAAHAHATTRSRPGHRAMSPITRPSQVKLSPTKRKGPLDRILQKSNPILLVSKESASPTDESSTGGQRLSRDDPGYKARRMQTHPYLSQAKDEVWTDPATGLQYPTDLCRYLGHERKASGRHTLMGVGQFKKLIVKIYGIAFYVSKRDALADPAMDVYAGLSADELRSRPEFLYALRKLSSTPGAVKNEAHVDRTLLLKTNMQLGVDTMTSSLEADWKMLTEDARSMLMQFSREPRPADENMLKLIKSPDNPSRCSCAQTAPDEYEANPTCCARGTELAFTWRKSGDLEIRLNGRLIQSFPRPDIAEGIFFEYLRSDDPMSPEFLDRVVDGFPFLLAPLAQVKGVSFGQGSKSSQDSDNPIFRAFRGMADAFSSQLADMGNTVQQGFSEAASNAGNAVKSIGDAAQNAAREMERRRVLLVKKVTSIPSAIANVPNAMMNIMTNRESDPLKVVSEFLAANITPTDQELEVVRKDSLGRAVGYPLSYWFSDTYQAPDEIGPMKIHPTMDITRKASVALVHLYLLLMFIVSFPGSNTTRTKLGVRKLGAQVPVAVDMKALSLTETMPDIDGAAAAAMTLASALPSSGLKKIKSAHVLAVPRLRPERVPCQARVGFSPRRLITRARQGSFRSSAHSSDSTSTADEDESTLSSTLNTPTRSPLGKPLGKKSLSYFL